MAKRGTYPLEFKQEAVGLVLGRSVQVARDARGEVEEPSASESERAEFERLRATVDIRPRGRDIPTMAAAFLAKENL